MQNVFLICFMYWCLIFIKTVCWGAFACIAQYCSFNFKYFVQIILKNPSQHNSLCFPQFVKFIVFSFSGICHFHFPCFPESVGNLILWNVYNWNEFVNSMVKPKNVQAHSCCVLKFEIFIYLLILPLNVLNFLIYNCSGEK